MRTYEQAAEEAKRLADAYDELPSSGPLTTRHRAILQLGHDFLASLDDHGRPKEWIGAAGAIERAKWRAAGNTEENANNPDKPGAAAAALGRPRGRNKMPVAGRFDIATNRHGLSDEEFAFAQGCAGPFAVSAEQPVPHAGPPDGAAVR